MSISHGISGSQSVGRNKGGGAVPLQVPSVPTVKMVCSLFMSGETMCVPSSFFWGGRGLGGIIIHRGGPEENL